MRGRYRECRWDYFLCLSQEVFIFCKNGDEEGRLPPPVPTACHLTAILITCQDYCLSLDFPGSLHQGLELCFPKRKTEGKQYDITQEYSPGPRGKVLTDSVAFACRYASQNEKQSLSARWLTFGSFWSLKSSVCRGNFDIQSLIPWLGFTLPERSDPRIRMAQRSISPLPGNYGAHCLDWFLSLYHLPFLLTKQYPRRSFKVFPVSTTSLFAEESCVLSELYSSLIDVVCKSQCF